VAASKQQEPNPTKKRNGSRDELQLMPGLADDQNLADPFDLDSLRAAPDLDDIAVEKILTTVPVRRPSKDQFYRVHPGSDFTLDTYVLEHESGMDHTTYLVAPSLWATLADHLRRVRLFTAIDKRSNIFLWPARLPTADGSGSARSWHQSALHAAEQAKKFWIKIQGNKAIGAYDIVVAKGDLGDPSWPDYSLQELIKVGFRDRFIDSLDHPVVREINGEI
jgi:hypothetical protein